MKIKKTNMLIIFLFLVAIISLGSVAATDTVVTSTDNSTVIDSNETTEFQEVISNETVNQENIDNNVMLDDEMSLMREDSSLNDNVNIGQANYENNSFTALDKLITDNTNGTIVLQYDYKMYSDEVNVYERGITINKNIAIIGNGHYINANKTGRIFNISSDGVILTLKNITLKNGNIIKGNRACGGAIYSNSTVNLICEDVNFVNNSADYGGAILAYNITITNSNGNVVFKNNTAKKSGGAILGDNVIINAINISFVNNSARIGGAIYSNGSASVNGTSVSFVNNKAFDGNGGAIYTLNGNVTVTVTDVSFVNNLADYGGGAIYTLNGNVTVTGTDVSFVNNSASSSGGAIFTDDGVTFNGVTVNAGNVSFVNNSASSYGGAIFAEDGVTVTGTDVSFVNNSVGRSGGAIYSRWSTVTCEDVSFVNNSAPEWGGAIFAQVGVTINCTDMSFVNNSASSSGGAIFADDGVTVNAGNVSFVNNSASSSGGAIYSRLSGVTVNAGNIVSFVNNTADNGGAIRVEMGGVTVTGTSVSFVNNKATQYVGAINAAGGSVTVTGTDVSFVNNTALLNDGAINAWVLTIDADSVSFVNNKAFEGNGGAIGASESLTINADSVSFVNNLAYGNGGAIYTSGNVTVNASSVSFVNNLAYGNGGAIYALSGSVSVNASGSVSFVNNSATDDDGAIYAYGSVSVSGSDVSFVNNSAGTYNIGGAINSGSDSVSVNANGSVRFVNNSAQNGGAIRAGSSVSVSGTSVSFVNNSASFVAGAIYAPAGSVSVNASGSVSFVSNKATIRAGAIYTYSGSVSVNATSVSFVNNSATLYGGSAIYSMMGNVSIANGFFDGNNGTSVIYAAGGSIVNSTFIGNHIIIGIPTVYQDCVLTILANNQPITSVKPNENFNLTAKLVDDKGNIYYSDGLTYQIYNAGTCIMNVTDVDELFNATANLTNMGVYTITAKYNDPDKKITHYTISNATVINTNVILTGKDIVKYYKGDENYNIYLKLADGTPLAGETVAVTVNGKTYNFVTDNNGLVSLPIGLSAGNYTIISIYNGGYGFSRLENNITVLSTIKGEDTTVYYRNGSSYVVHVMDSQGRTVVGQNVRMNINGVFYDRVTDSKGYAYLPIGLNAGKYIITAENPTNGELTSNIVTVLATLVGGQDVSVYHRNGSGYSIKVLDGQGNPACGVTVRMNINGVFYDRVTDSNGYAFLPIGLSPGEYIITTEYKGFMTSNKITVLPVLIGSDISLYYRDGTSYNVKLLDGQGKPLTFTNVTMNINGVFYYRTTNTDGVADLPIGLLPGQYIITTTYQDHVTSNTVTVLARD